MKLPADEIKKVEAFLEKTSGLEKNWEHPQRNQILNDLKNTLLSWQNVSAPLQKCTRYHEHIYQEMTLNQFVNILIPFERLLDRNLKDDDFLVSSEDQKQKSIQRIPVCLVVDNLRSSFNVGALFRTVDCLALEKIYLCGYTPTPEDLKTKKTSMGTSDVTPWESHSCIEDLIQQLKEKSYRIVALETSPKALSHTAPWEPEPTALIVGNERFGLDNKILKLCDEVRVIPTFGLKNSLNVAISFSIVGYEIRRQLYGN